MKGLNDGAVDEAAVARLVEGSKAPTLTRVLGTVAIVVAGTLVVVVLIPTFAGGELWPGLNPLSRRLVVGVAASVVLSVGIAFRMLSSYGGMTRADAVERIKKEWRPVESPGWRLRFFGVGLALGVSVGIPVGMILSFGSPANELPGGSRSLAVLAFVGLTLVWTIPAAYLIRMISKRSLRPFIK